MKYTLLNKKIVLNTIFVWLLLLSLSAQNYYTNLRKYWYYKSRLNNDFMKVGTGDGESLIFNQRGLYATSWQAGKEIILKATSTPGDGGEVVITPGMVLDGIGDSGIRFYIKKYDCATDNGNYDPNVDASYPYRIIQDTTSLGQKNYSTQNNAEMNNDTLRFLVKPHYVEYPEEYTITNNETPETLALDNNELPLIKEFVQIIPNPTENEATIIISDLIEYDKIEITNIMGEVVEKLQNTNEHQIKLDIRQYASGMYFVNFYNQGIFVHSCKLIKK